MGSPEHTRVLPKCVALDDHWLGRCRIILMRDFDRQGNPRRDWIFFGTPPRWFTETEYYFPCSWGNTALEYGGWPKIGSLSEYCLEK